MKAKAIGFAIFVLLTAYCMAADGDRRHIVLPRPSEFKALPFSDGVLVGETLYVGGHVGIDPKTGKGRDYRRGRREIRDGWGEADARSSRYDDGRSGFCSGVLHVGK